VNPYGQVVDRIGLLKEGVIIQDVAKNSYLSFYVRFGPIIPLIWGLLSIIGALTILKAGVKPKAHDSRLPAGH
jgi:apolipoprotein N-acyltransferase